MGAFKGLNGADVYLTDYVARKHWTATKSQFEGLGIKVYTFAPGSSEYCSLDQSFFRGVQEDGSVFGPYDLDLQTTITVPGSRLLSEGINLTVISIPRQCFDVQIEHKTVKVICNQGADICRDQEGLLLNGNNEIVGNIIYKKGLLIFSNGLVESDIDSISWTSNKPIFTYNVNCKVRDVDMNCTLNPTAKGLAGDGEFHPYITSVGLYNSSNELVAIAKLSKPVKKASNIDTVVKVRLDIL